MSLAVDSILSFSIRRVMHFIPAKLTKYTAIIDANVDEVKNDYIFSTKKSVVNFILGKSLEQTYTIDEHSTDNRIELTTMRKRSLNK